MDKQHYLTSNKMCRHRYKEKLNCLFSEPTCKRFFSKLNTDFIKNFHEPCKPQSRPDGYLARFCQNLAKTAYLARSDIKMVILQDLAEKWLSCKILASSFRSSCPLIGSHSCNTFHFDQKFT